MVQNLWALFFNLPVGNVEIPSLEDINLSIPSVSVSNIRADVDNISNMDLLGGSFDGLKAIETTVPQNGFQLSGLGLGNFSISSIQIPATSTTEAKLNRFQPKAEFVLPEASISSLNIPSSIVNNIQSDSIALDAVADEKGVGIDLGFLSITVFVQPIAHMFIGAMELEGVELSASVQKVRIEGIAVPLELRGIAMKGIDLTNIRVNEIKG